MPDRAHIFLKKSTRDRLNEMKSKIRKDNGLTKQPTQEQVILALLQSYDQHRIADEIKQLQGWSRTAIERKGFP